jgi:hypothetical protein
VRRWAEVVVALVFSKLILMFVFVTGLFVLIRGVGSTGAGATQGITQTVSGILILGLAGFAPWVAIKMAHFAGHHLEGMHAMAAGATAGATAVQSMARPVGTAMLPAAGLLGVAAGVGSSAKPWSPQTPGSSSGDTSAATEPVTPPGDSPSAGAAMASKGGGEPTTANGSSPGPSSTSSPPTASANGNGSTPHGRNGSDTPWSTAPQSTTQREPDFGQSREAARNTSPVRVSPISPAPPVPPTSLPKGDP